MFPFNVHLIEYERSDNHVFIRIYKDYPNNSIEDAAPWEKKLGTYYGMTSLDQMCAFKSWKVSKAY